MNDLQQQLQDKYDIIEGKIKELGDIKTQAYKTNGNFRYNPTNSYSSVDIPNTHNEQELIHAYAFIQQKSEAYHKAASDIGLKEYPLFKWCGFEPNDWYFDIQLRFKLIRHSSQLQKLEATRQKMIPYLPQENKIKQLLLEIGE